MNISAGTPGGGSPRIAVDSAGSINVLWRNQLGLGFSRSTDGGATFSAPTLIPTPLFAGAPEKLAVDATGTIHVAWSAPLASGSAILYARSTDGGASFIPAQSITRAPASLPGGSEFSVNLAVDVSGNVFVAWEETPPLSSDRDILLARSTDGGVSFSTPLNLSSSASHSLGPLLGADDGGNINIIWRERFEVFFARSTDGGATFSAPRNLSNTGGRSLPFDMAVDPVGSINIVWAEDSPLIPGGTLELLFTRSSDGGGSFSAPLAIGDTPGSQVSAKLVVDQEGDINVAWLDLEETVYFSRSTDSGASFSPPRDVSGGVFNPREPQLAVDGDGRISLAWQGFSDSDKDVFFTRSTDGLHFSPPRNLSGDEGASQSPRMALDGRGNVNIVWWDTSVPVISHIFFVRGQNVARDVEELVVLVLGLGLEQGLESSLVAKLGSALMLLDDVNPANDVAAVHTLESFITAVEAQRGINIADEQAEALVSAAGRILDALTMS